MLHLLSKIDSQTTHQNSENCKQVNENNDNFRYTMKTLPHHQMDEICMTFDRYPRIYPSKHSKLFLLNNVSDKSNQNPPLLQKTLWSCKVCHFILCWSNFWLNQKYSVAQIWQWPLFNIFANYSSISHTSMYLLFRTNTVV